MMSNFEYSEKEMKLFEYFGMKKIAHFIVPYQLYNMCADEAFLNKYSEGKETESLRRCFKVLEHISEHTIYRMTPEFDALIEFDEED
jgi:hypothetical protein